MDLELGYNEEFAEEELNVDDYIDDAAYANEGCGICMDIVIDRGVLDGCNHWFCFACIDNWATITNLCPLCKNEFQLITCRPVCDDDTLGNFNVDEHSLLREDDWSQEPNGTLSFPSYYINEDAVKCLDGDNCKMRSGFTTEGEDSVLDTSIACDSCDLWYHAFCVGFDPNNASGASWLCPRCTTFEASQNYDRRSFDNLNSVDINFPGKVSISIADAGETAIVVSMVDGKQSNEAASADQFASTCKDPENEKGSSSSFIMPQENFEVFSPIAESRYNMDAGQIQNAFISPISLSSGRTITTQGAELKENLLVFHSWNGGSSEGQERHNDNPKVLPPREDESQANTMSYGLTKGGDAATYQEAGVKTFTGDKITSIVGEKTHRKNALNGHCKKRIERSEICSNEQTMEKQAGSHVEEDGIRPKRPKSCESSQVASFRCPANTTVSVGSKGTDKEDEVPGDEESMSCNDMETSTSDIMSIVQGGGHKSSDRLVAASSTDKPKMNSTGGVRLKKILRVDENKDSPVLVQKLKSEIKEIVSMNPSKDFGKDEAFDKKLLAAFRAAVAGPQNGPVNKVNTQLLRMKKSMLRTGKTRDNLTKKIYGTASGRRRHLWDRDWEIEFWKHRSMSAKHEKVETLQSVLALLKKVSSSEMNEDADDDKKTILSRVYLADTSLFPRKEGIQPLFALAESSMSGKPVKDSQQTDSHSGKDSDLNHGNYTSKNSSVLSSSERFKTSSSVHANKAVISKVTAGQLGNAKDVGKQKAGGQPSVSAFSNQPPMEKADKKKWALEILARKNALTAGRPLPKEHNDNSELKGMYPLLAQLPADMRPVVTPGHHHNKVPLKVRQAQLYRLTEFYLRKTNLPVIQRTAATELAVADAINVESLIFERSNSKPIYINICSQHIVNFKPETAETVAFHNPRGSAKDIKLVNEESSVLTVEQYDSAEEALRMAGLFSDSPPSSPVRSSNDPNSENTSQINNKENLQNANNHSDAELNSAYKLRDGGDGAVPKISRIKVLQEPDCEKFEQNEEDGNDPDEASAIEETMACGSDKFMVAVEPPLDSPSVPTFEKEESMQNRSLKTTSDHLDPVIHSCKEKHEQPTLPSDEERCGFKRDNSRESCSEKEVDSTIENSVGDENESQKLQNSISDVEPQNEKCSQNKIVEDALLVNNVKLEQRSSKESMRQKKPEKPSETKDSVSLKVEAYIKEHIRPLCKSRIITVEQYRWAVGKTREKVMRYHDGAKNANFLIKEGEKVKKLAEQYVEATQKDWKMAAENKEKLPPTK